MALYFFFFNNVNSVGRQIWLFYDRYFSPSPYRHDTRILWCHENRIMNTTGSGCGWVVGWDGLMSHPRLVGGGEGTGIWLHEWFFIFLFPAVFAPQTSGCGNPTHITKPNFFSPCMTLHFLADTFFTNWCTFVPASTVLHC